VNIKALCAQYGLEESSINCLLDFLRRGIEKPGGEKMFKSNPAEFMRVGVEAWHAQGKAFYEELLEGTTERAQLYRKQIATQVWEQARANT
jgi:hypothetical protein